MPPMAATATACHIVLMTHEETITATATAPTNSATAPLTGAQFNTALLRPLVSLFAAVLAAMIFATAPGSAIALVYALPLGVLALEQHQKGWNNESAMIFALAFLSVIAIFIEPSAMNMVTGFCFVAAAGLAMGGIRPSDGLNLLRHTAVAALSAPLTLAIDVVMARVILKSARIGIDLRYAIVPLAAVLLFGSLLVVANPILAATAASLDRWLTNWIGFPFAGLTAVQIFFVFPATLALSWSLLRSRAVIAEIAPIVAPAAWHEALFRPASIAFTLLALNAMFLIENVLDLNHIWLKAALPPNMTHAQYVHRGSYTLIMTVILAAIFIMVALRPGTATNASKTIRQLVYVFAVQNLFLVLSSAKRTLSYVDAYGMSEWRLAGLIWMGLVAFGIGLTVWRIAKDRDNRWLINGNLVAAALVVLACGLMDFRPFIARWNVDQAMASLTPYLFDTRYNGETLGVPAYPALAYYRGKLAEANFPGSLQYSLRTNTISRLDEVMAGLRLCHQETQNDWRSWTFRYWFVEL
jgi:hypothetical protein